jgi:hypothetical protein
LKIINKDYNLYTVVRSLDYQLGTPRGRYDEHNSKFSLSMKPRFNRPVGERTLLKVDANWLLAVRINGTSNNVEPAHNTTKIFCPNLQ